MVVTNIRYDDHHHHHLIPRNEVTQSNSCKRYEAIVEGILPGRKNWDLEKRTFKWQRIINVMLKSFAANETFQLLTLKCKCIPNQVQLNSLELKVDE